MLRKTGVFIVGAIFCFATALAGAVTVDDIVKLHREGLGADVIKSFIETSGQVFQLSADDILTLKKAGVSEDIIKTMLETQKKTPPPQTAPPPSPQAPPPTMSERFFGTPSQTPAQVVEPNVPSIKKYNSVFQFIAYQNKKFGVPQRIAKVGQYDPLKNYANRAGTLLLTESALIMFDDIGQKKFELPYKEIVAVKVANRYPDEVEARFHPLDRYQLRVEFERGGKQCFFTLYAFPPPENPGPNYGSVPDIAKAIRELGGAVNPRLLEQKRKPQP